MPPLPPSAASQVQACQDAVTAHEQSLQANWAKSKVARIDSFKLAIVALIGAAMTEEVYGDNPPAVSVDEVYPAEPLPYVVAPFAGATLKLQATDFSGDAVDKITATWSGAPPITDIFTTGDYDYPCGIGNYLAQIQAA